MVEKSTMVDQTIRKYEAAVEVANSLNWSEMRFYWPLMNELCQPFEIYRLALQTLLKQNLRQRVVLSKFQWLSVYAGLLEKIVVDEQALDYMASALAAQISEYHTAEFKSSQCSTTTINLTNVARLVLVSTVRKQHTVSVAQQRFWRQFKVRVLPDIFREMTGKTQYGYARWITDLAEMTRDTDLTLQDQYIGVYRNWLENNIRHTKIARIAEWTGASQAHVLEFTVNQMQSSLEDLRQPVLRGAYLLPWSTHWYRSNDPWEQLQLMFEEHGLSVPVRWQDKDLNLLMAMLEITPSDSQSLHKRFEEIDVALRG